MNGTGIGITDRRPLGITLPPPPTVSISAAQSQAEGNSGTKTFTYTVTRSDTTGAVAVNWQFAAGTTSASDYQGGSLPAGGTVNMAAGGATGTFSVVTTGDTAVEGDESFTVSIAAPAGYALGVPSSATGTILNDDTAPPPSFTSQPSVTHDGTPTVGEELTGVDGGVSNGTVTSRQWLLDGTPVGGATGQMFTPAAAGSYIFRNVASGAGGSAQADSAAVVVGASGGVTAPLKVIFEGDSISASTNGPVSMASQYRINYDNTPVPIVNRAVSGSVVPGGAPSLNNRLATVTADAAGLNPVVHPIFIGANDLNSVTEDVLRTRVSAHVANLRAAIPGIKIGLGMILPSDTNPAGTYYRPNINAGRAAFNAWLRSQVGSLIEFVIPYGEHPSMVNGAADVTGALFNDGLHPSRSGASFMASQLEAVIQPMLAGSVATAPDNPNFPAFTRGAAGAEYTFRFVVTGLAMGLSANLSRTGSGTFAVNQGVQSTADKVVMNGDVVTVKVVAGATVGDVVSVTLTSGAMSAVFSVTTSATPSDVFYQAGWFNATNVTEYTGGMVRGDTGAGAVRNARSATSKPRDVAGKYYAEFRFDQSLSAPESGYAFGLIADNVANSTRPGQATGNGNGGFTLRSDNGAGLTQLYTGGTATTNVCKHFGPGFTMSVCVDTLAMKFWVLRNGVSINGDPVAGTGGYSLVIGTSATSVFLNAHLFRNEAVIINAGQRPFRYAPPAGFIAWDA